MTVSVYDTKETFLGDGVLTRFSFNFKVDTSADLLVFITSIDGTETILEEGEDVDYTVTLNTNQNSNPGGYVDLILAPGVGVPLVIMRGADFVRASSFTTSVPPAVIEQELDRLTMYAQQLREQLDRSLHVSAATQKFADVNYRNIQARAGKIVGFNDQGQAALYGWNGDSIVGPPGPMSASRVEFDAPGIVIRSAAGAFSHTSIPLTFIWTVDGDELESRSVTVTVDTDTATFVDPDLSENDGDDFTSTLNADGNLLIITSEFNEQREYAQLALVIMPLDEYPTDTFTPTWGAGFSSDPVGDVTYTTRAETVVLSLEAALTGDSDTSAMTWAAGTLPAEIRPSVERLVQCVLQYDDTTEVLGVMTIGTDGSATFAPGLVTAGLVGIDGVFQTGQDKGLPASWTVAYQL